MPPTDPKVSREERQSDLKAAPWRLTVALVSGETFAISHDKETFAYADVERFVKQGYVIRSDSEDVIEHNRRHFGGTYIYPLASVAYLLVHPASE